MSADLAERRVPMGPAKSWKMKKSGLYTRSPEIGCWSWKGPDFWPVWSEKLVCLHVSSDALINLTYNDVFK